MTPDSLARLARASALVLQMAVSAIVGVGLGAWLDERFGTSPFLLLLLGAAGMAGGLFQIYRTLDAPSS